MASVFTKIINGELPGHFVYEDEQAVAIMTIQPAQPGHVLVIPREEIDHWDEVPTPLYNHLNDIARRIAKAQKAVYNCKRVSMSIVGIEVPHTHLHVIPINAIGDVKLAGLDFADAEVLAAEAEKLRAAL